MKKLTNLFLVLSAVLLHVACNDDDVKPDLPVTISKLNFIDELVIPDGQTLDGEVVGGLSGIDYHNGVFYIISDAAKPPIRFYTATLKFDEAGFTEIPDFKMVELLNEQGKSFEESQVDPEAIRFDPVSGNLIWASEGFANSKVNPFVRQASVTGQFVKEYELPSMFKLNRASEQEGIRHNGVFEGLSLSVDGKGYWVGMELPLVQDGSAPVYGEDKDSKVRISYIDRASGKFGRQFPYDLGPVVREGGFMVNGLVEVLEYAQDKFLVLERSFASGTDDGGNDVYIYDVDASNATDVSAMNPLDGTVVPATKKLLFSFNDIRDQLSSVPGSEAKVVDNLEGMTFGPDLPNGNKSLVVVADNNFSAFGPQLNQFIVLEVVSNKGNDKL